MEICKTLWTTYATLGEVKAEVGTHGGRDEAPHPSLGWTGKQVRRQRGQSRGSKGREDVTWVWERAGHWVG